MGVWNVQMRWRSSFLVAASGLLVLALVGTSVAEPRPATNGFDLSKASVPTAEILGGGPKRDGIHAVDEPGFAAAAEANWVEPENPVVALTLGAVTRAYPVHLLEYHQIVNDRIGDQPVVVTYDPLAGVPRAFKASLGGEALTFGVAGLIRNHNFLFYDRQGESLWQQISGDAISGKRVGQRLEAIRVRHETMASVTKRNPGVMVLRPPRPKSHDYSRSPFERYWQTNNAVFPLRAEDNRFHLKEMVLGLRAGSKTRAYLGSLATAAEGVVEDEFEGHAVRLVYDSDSATFVYEVPDGVELIEAYWLAWKAWFPDTELWHDPGPIPEAPRPAR